MDENILEPIPARPLSRALILEVVQKEFGGNFSESDPLIGDLEKAMGRKEPLTFATQGKEFTVSCGCIITTAPST